MIISLTIQIEPHISCIADLLFTLSQAQPWIMLSMVRSLCFSATMLWYRLQCRSPCVGSANPALEKTTWFSWFTSSPYAWQSWAAGDVSKDKSWASVSRGKRQLRLLYPWLYISSKSLRQAARWRCKAQLCIKFNLRANRSKRTGFLSRKALLMDRASVTVGELRSRSGSSMMCCEARAEPAGIKERKASMKKWS